MMGNLFFYQANKESNLTILHEELFFWQNKQYGAKKNSNIGNCCWILGIGYPKFIGVLGGIFVPKQEIQANMA
jgi:hypothetical protein